MDIQQIKAELRRVRLIAVNSSNIKRVGYRRSTRLLFVEFRHGGTYAYSDVSEALYKALRQAESIGKELNTKIKGHHEYLKITN